MEELFAKKVTFADFASRPITDRFVREVIAQANAQLAAVGGINLSVTTKITLGHLALAEELLTSNSPVPADGNWQTALFATKINGDQEPTDVWWVTHKYIGGKSYAAVRVVWGEPEATTYYILLILHRGFWIPAHLKAENKLLMWCHKDTDYVLDIDDLLHQPIEG